MSRSNDRLPDHEEPSDWKFNQASTSMLTRDSHLHTRA